MRVFDGDEAREGVLAVPVAADSTELGACRRLGLEHVAPEHRDAECAQVGVAGDSLAEDLRERDVHVEKGVEASQEEHLHDGRRPDYYAEEDGSALAIVRGGETERARKGQLSDSREGEAEESAGGEGSDFLRIHEERLAPPCHGVTHGSTRRVTGAGRVEGRSASRESASPDRRTAPRSSAGVAQSVWLAGMGSPPIPDRGPTRRSVSPTSRPPGFRNRSPPRPHPGIRPAAAPASVPFVPPKRRTGGSIKGKERASEGLEDDDGHEDERGPATRDAAFPPQAMPTYRHLLGSNNGGAACVAAFLSLALVRDSS